MEIRLGTELVTVECTWGEGPNVSMAIHRSERHVKNWKEYIPLDLTSDEAERLAHMLLMAAKQARELDDLCEQHDQWVEEHGEDG